MSTHTIQTVRTFVETHRESEEPDAILAILKEHDGKQLTKRLLAKLPGGEERWQIRTSMDRTYLSSYAQGNGGIHLLVAYRLTNVMIDASWIEEHNPAYFKGRRDRNALRDATASNPAALQSMVAALNSYAAAKAMLDRAKVDLESLTGYGKPFSPDSFDWERLWGARRSKVVVSG